MAFRSNLVLSGLNVGSLNWILPKSFVEISSVVEMENIFIETQKQPTTTSGRDHVLLPGSQVGITSAVAANVYWLLPASKRVLLGAPSSSSSTSYGRRSNRQQQEQEKQHHHYLHNNTANTAVAPPSCRSESINSTEYSTGCLPACAYHSSSSAAPVSLCICADWLVVLTHNSRNV